MPGFHMIATIAVIAAIAEKKKVQRSQRSHRKHSPAIAATTIPEIEKVPSQRLLLLQSLWSLRSLESGFYMIAMIAAIAERFFLSDRSDHMENRLKRQKYPYYTNRRSFFGPKMHAIPLRMGCQGSEILVSLFSLLSSGWKTVVQKEVLNSA